MIKEISKIPEQHSRSKSNLTSDLLPKIRNEFLKRDQMQNLEYIKDLEETIVINKEVIADLLTDAKSNSLNKTIILLNKENALLQKRLKITITARNQYQSKALLLEQMLENMKRKIYELEAQLTEKSELHETQLAKKEYELEDCQEKLKNAIDMLRRYAVQNIEDNRIIHQSNLVPKNRNDNKIENLNKDEPITSELKKSKENILTLESKVSEMFKEINIKKDTYKYDNELNETAHEDLKDVIIENKKLKSTIIELSEENKNIVNRLNDAKEKNSNLSKFILKLKDCSMTKERQNDKSIVINCEENSIRNKIEDNDINGDNILTNSLVESESFEQK